MGQVFSRVLLKLSGKVCGDNGVDVKRIGHLTKLLIRVLESKSTSLAIVLGGGNIIRGRNFPSEDKYDRVPIDQMGMLGTLINGLALQRELEANGVEVRVMSSLRVDEVAEFYKVGVARGHLDKGRVVILVCGLGIPFCSADYATVERAIEVRAEIILKGTNIDGVYDGDPNRDSSAKFLPFVSYERYLLEQYYVMDFAAIKLARDQGMPIRIFNFFKEGNLEKVLTGEEVGSLIYFPQESVLH